MAISVTVSTATRALRLEGDVLVVLGEGGLVGRHRRGGNKLQAEPRHPLRDGIRHLLRKAVAVHTDVVKFAAGGCVLDRVDQNARQKFLCRFAGTRNAGSERLRSGGNSVRRRFNPELEFHVDIGAQPIHAHHRM